MKIIDKLGNTVIKIANKEIKSVVSILNEDYEATMQINFKNGTYNVLPTDEHIEL